MDHKFLQGMEDNLEESLPSKKRLKIVLILLRSIVNNMVLSFSTKMPLTFIEVLISPSVHHFGELQYGILTKLTMHQRLLSYPSQLMHSASFKFHIFCSATQFIFRHFSITQVLPIEAKDSTHLSDHAKTKNLQRTRTLPKK